MDEDFIANLIFTFEEKKPGDLIRSQDWNTAMGAIADLGEALSRVTEPPTGPLTVEGALKVNGPVTAEKYVGNTIVLGPPTASSLSLGYHTNYSGIQSHGHKPLAINPLGNNVGIGTTEPQAKLHISGGSDAAQGVAGSGSLIIGDADGIHLALDNNEILAKASGTTAGTLRLQNEGGLTFFGGPLNVSGNVGLGTPPDQAYKLSVHGNVQFSGHVVDGGWVELRNSTITDDEATEAQIALYSYRDPFSQVHLRGRVTLKGKLPDRWTSGNYYLGVNFSDDLEDSQEITRTVMAMHTVQTEGEIFREPRWTSITVTRQDCWVTIPEDIQLIKDHTLEIHFNDIWFFAATANG